MNKILISIIAVFMMSNAVMADDTTCANGAGIVVVGATTGHQYCRSKHSMNWWNAHAWCEGLKSRLFDLDFNNCGCNGTINCASACPELAFGGDDTWVWTSVPYGTKMTYDVHFRFGAVHAENNREDIRHALCY